MKTNTIQIEEIKIFDKANTYYNLFLSDPISEEPTDIFKFFHKYEELLPINNSYSVEQWNLILAILQRFYLNGKFDYENIKSPVSQEKTLPVDINLIHANYWINNLTELSFNRIFPSLIEVVSENNILFSIVDFPFYFKDVNIKYDIIKNNDLETAKLMKIWINMTYGILSRNNLFLRCDCDITHKISLMVINLMRTLYRNFSNHIVYYDIDVIYFLNFDEIKERVVDFLNIKYGYITYNFENKSGIFLAKKKYILQENLELKFKGIRQK